MPNKNILVIHPSLGNGGAEKIIAFVSNALSKDHIVKLLLLKDAKKTVPLDNCIEVIERNCYSSLPIISKDIIKGFKTFYNLVEEIKDEITLTRPDMILCFDLRVLLATRLALGKRDSIKILFSERADPYENPLYWSKILKWIYKDIGYVIFQTEEARKFYSNEMIEKSSVIANPALSRALDNPSMTEVVREPYFFAAGRFQYRKGFDILIKAFSEVIKSRPNYRLIIYGEGMEESSLRTLIRDGKLQEAIDIVAPLPNVIENNINAELFILPSRSEGIPNILIEAMMVGIPCIATDCSPGGAKLLTDNGRVCLLANNDDYKSLAEKLIYAIDNKENMKMLAHQAKISLKRFDAEKIAGEWRNVVKTIINN